MTQTSYLDRYASAFAGMLADLRDHEAVAKQNGEASLSIPFGVGVMIDAAASGDVLLPRQASFTSQGWVGVSIHKHNEEGEIIAGDMLSILRRGVIWVVTETAVTAANLYLPSQVKMRVLASGGNTQLGAFRGPTADADADSTATVVGARWLSAASAGGLAMLEIPDAVTLTLDS